MDLMFENSLEIISFFYFKKESKFYINKNIFFYLSNYTKVSKEFNFIKQKEYNKIEIKKIFFEINKTFGLSFYKLGKFNFNYTRYKALKMAQSLLLNFTWILKLDIIESSSSSTTINKKKNDHLNKIINTFYNLKFYELIILSKIVNLKFQYEFKKNLKLISRDYNKSEKMNIDLNNLILIYYLNEFLFSFKSSYFIMILLRNFIDKLCVSNFSVKKKLYINNFKLKEIIFLDTIVKQLKRYNLIQVVLKIPMKQILEEAEDIGFVRKTGFGFKASSVGYLVNKTHREILEFYNKFIIKTLQNYFFMDNRKSFNLIIRKLKRSCALTLALKYKLRFAGKVFKEYGENLVCPETHKHFFTLI